MSGSRWSMIVVVLLFSGTSGIADARPDKGRDISQPPAALLEYIRSEILSKDNPRQCNNQKEAPLNCSYYCEFGKHQFLIMVAYRIIYVRAQTLLFP